MSFDGPTRDSALSDFEDWLKGEFGSALAPGDITTALLQALVANSPVDPVAGNPNSLQSRMFDADFRMGTDGGLAPSLFSLDIGGGYYDADALMSTPRSCPSASGSDSGNASGSCSTCRWPSHPPRTLGAAWDPGR